MSERPSLLNVAHPGLILESVRLRVVAGTEIDRACRAAYHAVLDDEARRVEFEFNDIRVVMERSDADS